MIKAPQIPLKFDDRDGYADIAGIKALVKFHLKNLLLTYPGEKISDPEYGVGIKKYLFEPLTEETLNYIEDEVETAIISNLRYLTGVKVSAEEIGPNSINVKIRYIIPSMGADIFDVNVVP
jgi:phage baseplate assembly protein W